jgi:hypothetical protein
MVNKETYWKNPEKYREEQKRWRSEHPEYYANKMKEYYKNYPEKRHRVR